MSPIRKGFTLIEVAVVLVVLAILAAIAIPTFNAFMDGVDENAARTTVEGVIKSVTAKSTLDDGNTYPLQGPLVTSPDPEADVCSPRAVIWQQVTGENLSEPNGTFPGELGNNGDGSVVTGWTCAGGDGTSITTLVVYVQGSRGEYFATVDLNTGEITRFENTIDPALA